MLRSLFSLFLAASVSLAMACGDDGIEGPYEFVSADGYEGAAAGPPRGGGDAGTDIGTGGADDERVVEEGDIYRVLGDGLLLNLNAYRGLQVIDLSDVDDPTIIGSYRVTGAPVEMYVIGDTAVVLMNSWRGYYGARDDVWVESATGGLVLTVDLADPTAPALVDTAFVPGAIQKSRVVRDSEHAALYVAAGGWAEWEEGDGTYVWESRTVVKSFDVSTAELLEVSELNLGGHVSDIQATPDALLVARDDWERGMGSKVSVIDISDPTGRMALADEVTVAGRVETQFNMDLRGDVLRIASGAAWTATRTNHLETFDAADLGALAPIDHCTYGDGEDLYATIFLDDRAFFVTYERVDPFHAFALDADGHCEERAEFIVSGWNDFFRPVLADTRLIGIGVNDEGGSRTMAVSLYDITDLDNASPMVARAEVEADDSWSEANWDHRAFSVIEDVVAVTAPDGTPESGLVLLPFTGWSEGSDGYVAAVQIYTFSDGTLTRRGLMEHGSPVRRSFLAGDDLTANISDAELTLYGTAVPDVPVAHGRLDLAPSYRRLLTFGDHRVRLRDGQNSWSWWGPRADRPFDEVQVVPSDVDPDSADAVARFDVPAGSRLVQVGALLLVVDSVPRDTSDWPYVYDTTLVVHDFSDPAVPHEVGRLVTDRITPDGYGYGYPVPGDCFDCGYRYDYGLAGDITVAGDAVVFASRQPQEALVGIEHVCHTWPEESGPCTSGSECTFYDGGITCRSIDGGPEVCEGAIAACGVPPDDVACVEIDPSTIATRTECGDHELRRYWQSMTLEVLDLSNPAAPVLAPSTELPVADEAVSIIGGDGAVYYTYRRPTEVVDPADPRPVVAWFFRAIDLSAPLHPVVGAPVNVPGELIAIDGAALYTRDLRWGERTAETLVHRLELLGDRALLLGSQRFSDRLVQGVVLDGAGHVLVTDRPPWSYDGGIGVGTGTVDVGAPGGAADVARPVTELARLSILDATTLDVVAEVDVDTWATLNGAEDGRALFQVPGGLLLLDLRDATHPAPQAYFPLQGWPSEVLFEGDEILLAAGPFGIYRFDANDRNIPLAE